MRVSVGQHGDVTLPIALEEALAGFTTHLRDERGRGPNTVRAYLGDVADLLGFAAEQGVAELPDLDLAVLRAWLAGMDRRGAARSTISRHVAAARSFTGWAMRQGLVERDPAARLSATVVAPGDPRGPAIGPGRRAHGRRDPARRRRGSGAPA